jgi:addiction module HigA family antidote
MGDGDMTQTLAPARVSSPGRILGRELEARGWTQKDLAEIMGRPHQTINGIIKGNKHITPETAIELADALGTSAEFWTNLEAKYRLHIASLTRPATQGELATIRRIANEQF